MFVKNEKFKFIAVGLLSILISLLIIELALRLIDKPSRPISGWNDCKRPNECNYLGFRGAEITYSPDDYVVVLLGDSLAAAWYLPFEQMPERRLEQYLKQYKKNVKVVTIGTHGYGQDQQLLALKEYYKKHRADLVLLFLSIRTDIEDNIFPESGNNHTIKPTFWIENGELRGPTEGWLEPVGTQMKLSLLWKSYFGKSLGETRLEMWKKKILPPPYQPMTHYQGKADTTWNDLWKQNPREVYKDIEYEREVFANQLTPRSKMRDYGIDLSRRLFTKIRELVEIKKGHFIIFKEERPWEIQYTDSERVNYMNGKYYKLSMRQYHDTLKKLLDGFEHYRIPLDLDSYTVSAEDTHLNQKAIDKLMNKLALIISGKEYFPGR